MAMNATAIRFDESEKDWIQSFERSRHVLFRIREERRPR